MPSPSDYDNQKDFVSACIPVVLKEGTAKDQKQAAAICFSMWKQHKSKEKSPQMVIFRNDGTPSIQMVIFNKNRSPRQVNRGKGWTVVLARHWLRRRDLKSSDMDEMEDTYFFHQFDLSKISSETMPAGVAMVSCDTNRAQDALEDQCMDSNLDPTEEGLRREDCMRVERVSSVDVDNGTFGMTLATEGEATDGHILSIEGAQLIDRMPMLISHWNEPTKAAGSIFKLRRHLQDNPRRLTAIGMMELDGDGDGAAMRRDLLHMISRGHINAVSVKWDFDWKDAIPRSKLPNDHPHYIDVDRESSSSPKRWGYYFKKWAPREGSIVAVGADPKALIGRSRETTGQLSDWYARMAEEAQLAEQTKDAPSEAPVMPDLPGLVSVFGARVRELGSEVEHLVKLGVPFDELQRVLEQNKPVAPVDETLARLMQRIESLESRLAKAENGRVAGAPSAPDSLGTIVRQAVDDIRRERRTQFEEFRAMIRARQGKV